MGADCIRFRHNFVYSKLPVRSSRKFYDSIRSFFSYLHSTEYSAEHRGICCRSIFRERRDTAESLVSAADGAVSKHSTFDYGIVRASVAVTLFTVIGAIFCGLSYASEQ